MSFLVVIEFVEPDKWLLTTVGTAVRQELV